MKKMNLQMFAYTPGVDAGTQNINPINVTTQQSMSPTMKTFYDTSLLENAREQMVFSQLGKKQGLRGNKVEFRKFNTFKKALKPLEEGVIPTGQNFGMTKIEATTTQHGDYTAVSDRLELESYDDVIYGATEEMGAAGGETFDTLTRNILLTGTSVYFCPAISGATLNATYSRDELDNTCLLTPDVVARVVTQLKKNKAPKYDGQSYVMVIHPSQAYDLRASKEWKDFHQYADVMPIFKGEIGMLHGMRFIESNETKIYKGEDLTEAARTLAVKTAVTSASTVAVKEAITSDEATALAGRKILIGDELCEIATASSGTAGNATITLTEALSSAAVNTVIYPGEGGKEGCATYGSLAFGKDAFGVLDPEGEGMEMIVKGKSEIGGPLEQFSTIGYKFCHGAVILYAERMIRVESGSDYSDVDEAN